MTRKTEQKLTFTGDTGTLAVGNDGIYVCSVMALIAAGASRGDNLAVGLTDGRLARKRVRDQLTTEVEIGIDGRFDLNGDPVACTTEAEFEENLEDMQWAVVEFFDTDCVGRAFDLTVEFPSGRQRQGAGHLERIGTWRRVGRVATVALLITVDAGILEAVAGSS